MIQLNGFKFYLARKAGSKARWACSTHHRYGCRAAILTVDDLITSLNQSHMHKGKGIEESEDRLEPVKKGKKKNKNTFEIYENIETETQKNSEKETYEIQEKDFSEPEEKLILESVDDDIYEAGEMYKVLHLDPSGESFIIELQNTVVESQYSD